MLSTPSPTSTRSDAEWQLRVDLAACYHLVAHYGLTDQIYTHITARVPGKHDQFLINPYGLQFDEISASSLVKIDIDGAPVEATPYRVNPAGFTIHSAIHAARPDAACVLHSHTTAGMAFAALDSALLPLNQISMQFYNRLAYHAYEGIALDLAERARIVGDLGGKRAMVMTNHGLLTVGRSVAEAFSLMYYLDRACAVQLAAQATGVPLHIPPPAVCERAAQQYDKMLFDDADLMLEWQANLRLLERSGATYAQ